MSYSPNNLDLLKRTITGIADFSGRSRRTEVLYYIIACALLGVVVHFIVGAVTPFDTMTGIMTVFRWVTILPVFALFVRRLHDQNRTGWYGTILPLGLLLGIPQEVAGLNGGVTAAMESQFSPMGIASSLCMLAVLFLLFLPESAEPNRYGPDPRLTEDY